MKLQKQISLGSGTIAIGSLGLSIVCNYYGCSFLCNIFVGLFSSGILVFATALFAYFSERNKTILSLYRGCHRFMEQLNLNLTPDGEVPVKDIKNNLSAMQNSYSVDIYYYVCELSNLRKRSKLYRIIMAIWEASRNIYLLILDDSSQIMNFYLGDISQQDLSNYKFKYVGDESIKHIADLQKALDDLRYHMNYYNSKKEQQEEQADAD